MANVSFIRPELAKLLPMYKLIRDVLSGEVSVKGARTAYLPMPNQHDISPENTDRYDAYLKRAVFYNVARRTLKGMVGQVFAKEPEIQLPALLDPMITNADGSGVSIKQLAQKAMQLTVAYSRCGLLVDYPDTEESGGASVQALRDGYIRPTLSLFPAQNIINWRTASRGAEKVLTLVVIYETWCVQDDGFEMKNSGQFRVLRLDDNGEYVQEIWREPEPTSNDGERIPRGNFVEHLTLRPRDANGQPLTTIPFMFIGGENNDDSPDNPAFYDLAALNVAHYRNSADYEESCYITGQATPVLVGLTEEWACNVLGGKINFGSRGGIMLPEGGNAMLLQASANSMSMEAMQAKERQMVALGAKLVEQKQVQRTATEAGLESAAETSSLAVMTNNVSDAFEWALKWAARWVGQPDSDVMFSLNTDFDVARMSAQDRAQLISEWQQGAITFEEMRNGLRKAGMVTVDDETAKTQIASESMESMVSVIDNGTI